MHTGFFPSSAPSLPDAKEARRAMAARPVQTKPGHEVDLLLETELLSAQPRTSLLPAPTGLQVCPACGLPFVVPGDVRELVGADSVRLELGCTSCGWNAVEVHTDEELGVLDIALDRSFADLLWTLEVLWLANEESAIERFAAALAADAIVPEDF
jgi:hypothetical protein